MRTWRNTAISRYYRRLYLTDPVLSGFARIGRQRRGGDTRTNRDKCLSFGKWLQTFWQAINGTWRFLRNIQNKIRSPVSLSGSSPSGGCQDLFTYSEYGV